MKHKYTAIIIVILLTSILALIYRTNNTEIIIANNSGIKLSKLVVSGNGFNICIPSISPGDEYRKTVKIEGESSIELHGESEVGPIAFGPDGYIENGYELKIQVNSLNKITIETRIK